MQNSGNNISKNNKGKKKNLEKKLLKNEMKIINN